MSSRFGPKHQAKVNECYPRSVGEVGPVSSKVSTLIYYINSRPSKLLKVSAYLERKIQRDLSRESATYNIVTLDIVDAIMHGCSDYFATFVPTVLRIMFMFADEEFNNVRTEELSIRLHGLFVEFCRMTKAVLPSMRDGQFFELLTHTLYRIFGLRHDGDVISSSMLIAKDIQGAVAMEDFRAPKGEFRISIVVSALIREFHKLDATKLSSENFVSKDRERIRQTTNSPESQFGTAFISLIEGANSATVGIIVSCIFREFDKDEWIHQRLCLNLLKLMVLTIPAQYLCMMLSEVFKKLERADENVVVILIDAVAELLLSNRSPLGYSAIELATNLLKLLRKQKPHAFDESRVPFTMAKIPPPRTIFSICTAFVSLLKNANFALQKYEIIEHIINKVYFYASSQTIQPTVGMSSFLLTGYAGSANPGSRVTPDSLMKLERHTVGTVVLNTTEERHFQSVVWGILNALANEGTPSAALKLTFVEVHHRLFEQIFQMALSADPDFSLNSMVLWKRLLDHGMSISPHRKNLAMLRSSPQVMGLTSPLSASLSNTSSVSLGSPALTESYSLGKNSVYLLTKSRAVLASTCKKSDISILHYAAVCGLLGSILRECDFVQLAISINLILWMHEMTKTYLNFTFEDHVCMACFTSGLIRDAGRLFGNDGLIAIGEGVQDKLTEAGVQCMTTEEVLDISWRGPTFSEYHEFAPKELLPVASEIRDTILRTIKDNAVLEKIKEIFGAEYTHETDAIKLRSLQPSVEKGPVSFKKYATADPLSPVNSTQQQQPAKSSSGVFSRLSRMGSGMSTTTMPAYYRASSIASVDSFSGNYNTHSPTSRITEPFGNPSPIVMPAVSCSLNDISPSSNSTGSIDSGSYSMIDSDESVTSDMTSEIPSTDLNSSRNNFLDVQFDELAVRVRQDKKQNEGKLSILFQGSQSLDGSSNNSDE